MHASTSWVLSDNSMGPDSLGPSFRACVSCPRIPRFLARITAPFLPRLMSTRCGALQNFFVADLLLCLIFVPGAHMCWGILAAGMHFAGRGTKLLRCVTVSDNTGLHSCHPGVEHALECFSAPVQVARFLSLGHNAGVAEVPELEQSVIGGLHITYLLAHHTVHAFQ